jgi:DNA-binding transcriptional ArsR family regulator
LFDYSRNMEMKDATTALSALGQDTRLAVFRLLVQAGPEGLAAGAIAEALSVPPATLSFHLKELGAAGLAVAMPQGRSIRYRADFDAMEALIGFLTHNCCGGNAEACRPAVASGSVARRKASAA